MKKVMYGGFLRLLVILCLCLAVTGCGNKNSKALDEYKTSMTEFYDELARLDEAINKIDPDSETAKVELLGYLDEMNQAYKTMSAIAIPDEFSGIADIAREAAEYMQMANEFYHNAYDGDFSEEDESLASQYYERANNRVKVMLQVLHGEVPSGEGVTVSTQEPGQFSTIGATTGATTE